MKKTNLITRLLKIFYHYLLFFFLVAFLVTCSMTLFITTFTKDLNIVLDNNNLQNAAKITFINVLILSTLFTIVDIIRRKLTTERITRHITSAANQMINGNFNVRINPISQIGIDDNYIDIINCFNKMAEELSSVETLKTDFIANVSHEMKTPLAIIQSYAKLLENPYLDEKEKLDYAKRINAASKNMSELITNILKLSQLDNQKIYPNIKEYDLGEQITNCLLQFENIWEEKNIEIEVDIKENMIIKADSELLSLVWNNLLSNAFKFTNINGKVSISLSSLENKAVFKVSDSGCGMNEEVGKHIFERFYQGEISHSNQGNGLGLSLVKKVIDILHGDIEVESKVNEGTTFTVIIDKNNYEYE